MKIITINPDADANIDYIDPHKAFEEIKSLVECDTLEMHVFRIGKHLYDIWMDDCGKLVGKAFTAYSERYGWLNGNLVVTHHNEDDEDGNFYTLTKAELDNFFDQVSIGALDDARRTLVVVLNDFAYL